MTCTGSDDAQEGPYTNLASVEGTTPVGVVVRDEDPSNYFGGQPGINLEKHTNGVDADEPTGVFIPLGADVEWTYEVTNTGNATLNNLVVTDDQGVEVTCPATSIPPGELVICTAPIAAADIGQYSNTGEAAATSQVGNVSDDDPSHYFGFVSEIHVEKYVNGDDADTAPGLALAAGDPITWTYQVTNPGNIVIRDVVLVDDQRLVPVFVSGDGDVVGDLEPGETWTYEATSTAVAGHHVNVATVTGLDFLEEPVADDDPAHYSASGVLPGETATIGDTVWEDLNADGDQDADEPGIKRARVDITNLDSGATVTATTDADGHYLVPVAPGDYTAQLDMTSVGSVLTTPGSYTLRLSDGEEDLTADFGVIEEDNELPNTSLESPLGPLPDGLLTTLGLFLVCAAYRAAFAIRGRLVR
jgi:hypothetical protein